MKKILNLSFMVLCILGLNSTVQANEDTVRARYTGHFQSLSRQGRFAGLDVEVTDNGQITATAFTANGDGDVLLYGYIGRTGKLVGEWNGYTILGTWGDSDSESLLSASTQFKGGTITFKFTEFNGNSTQLKATRTLDLAPRFLGGQYMNSGETSLYFYSSNSAVFWGGGGPETVSYSYRKVNSNTGTLTISDYPSLQLNFKPTDNPGHLEGCLTDGESYYSSFSIYNLAED